jgi:hypothetical protein
VCVEERRRGFTLCDALLTHLDTLILFSFKDFFFNLHDSGFVIFSKEANYLNGAGAVEYAFIKLSTDFFVNNTIYTKMI